MRRCLFRTLSIVAAVLLLAAAAASATTFTIEGTLTALDPTMTLVQINEPNCGAQSGMAIHYKLASSGFQTRGGLFTFALSTTFNRGAFYLYQASFNPANGTANCVAAANLGDPKRVTKFLRADVLYIIVIVNNTADQDIGFDFTVTISGPRQKVVDFNNDGLSDLAVVRNEGGNASWWIADTASASFSHVSWGLASDVSVPADYEGFDGSADVAVWRPGPLGTAGFWIKNSNGGGVLFVPFGQTGDDPTVIGDYDDDGWAEMAIYRPGAAPGQLSFWFFKLSPGSPFVGTVWGQHGDIPVPGDFDGDGRHDFTVRRDAGGPALFLMKLTSGGITGGFVSSTFGLASDQTVPGDYDGDGKIDIAVIRNVSGALQWWIRRSSDGAIVGQTFGLIGDVPAAGDYDGDGKVDIAVWRPGTPGVFWVSKSTGGLLTRIWGQTGDVPAISWNIH